MLHRMFGLRGFPGEVFRLKEKRFPEDCTIVEKHTKEGGWVIFLRTTDEELKAERRDYKWLI